MTYNSHRNISWYTSHTHNHPTFHFYEVVARASRQLQSTPALLFRCSPSSPLPSTGLLSKNLLHLIQNYTICLRIKLYDQIWNGQTSTALTAVVPKHSSSFERFTRSTFWPSGTPLETSYVFTKAWNDLPQVIRTMTALNLFKRTLILHLTDRYMCGHWTDIWSPFHAAFVLTWLYYFFLFCLWFMSEFHVWQSRNLTKRILNWVRTDYF